MKLHLARLARAQGEVTLPAAPAFRAVHLVQRAAVDEKRLYILLEGELVIDLPDGSYLHLKPGEAAQVPAPHVLVPIEEAVIAAWTV
ncbi:hypothetical protein [Marinithermus hydrothermalis]|uniref:Cupin 2 conserved barrel domain protein n=1 Tax=Marinithermus hydrothermalis (strain DSM 14884 / JCM 11576 / T1) TaxID=869210 RepID=F2NLP2_MARHT|nr:hypothetical protein [Marinithermus hydrothermalis]AEB10872.1 hypothetical protein Marky_0109 [Marinithermus hydrothermalis DSM 14884]